MAAGKRWKAVLPLGAGAAIASLPTPAGLETDAWRYFALFAAVLVGIILEPIPAAAIGLLGVTVATVLGYVRESPAESIRWGLSGFSNGTVWLIFGAFMLSMGYERSGLGRRVALSLVKHLGGRTLGLGYAIALADLALAPGMPSNTARSAGTIFPVLRNIPALFGSHPGPTARRIGAYLMWTAFASTAVTSSLFMTALAPNLLAVALVKETAGLDITWGQWLVGALPVGAVLLALTPLLVYLLYPPEIRSSLEAPAWAGEQLGEMGSVSPKEWVMAGLVLLSVALWIFGGHFVNATTVVLIIISLMVVLGVLEWDEILGNKTAWNILVWFATLVTLAGGLNEVGLIRWFAEVFSRQLGGYPVMAVMGGLVVFFFLIHYMFASLTAHTAAVLPVVLAVGVAVPGLPVLPFSLLLCYSLGLMGVITPYATGPAPVYYASGFVSRTDFWRLGLIFGVLYLGALLAIGMPFLTFLEAAPGTSPATALAGKFVPPEGRTLLIVGQDLEAVDGYTAGVHAPPGGITTYTSVFSLAGLRETADWGSGRVNGQASLDARPDSILAIGLHMVETDGEELNRLVHGAYDEPIDELGEFIREAGRPVYLRIGYEFDGSWNHYAPAEYIAAYRHVVDRLRSSDVTNFATVWQSGANVTFEDRRFTEWWPGDEYVDWVGTSFFLLDENLERHSALIEWAERKGKPLMICEAAPRGYSVDESPDGPPPFTYPDRGLTFSRDGEDFSPRTSEQIWDEWYVPLFALVRENTHVIRAVAYINVEWNAQRMWGSGPLYWGDSRIEANALIKERWLAEIGRDTWLHGGPGLFEALESGR